MVVKHTHTRAHGVRRKATPCRLSVGSCSSLVVNADADTARIRAARKSKALINTDDSAPSHRAMVCVCVCVCLCVCVCVCMCAVCAEGVGCGSIIHLSIAYDGKVFFQYLQTGLTVNFFPA